MQVLKAFLDTVIITLIIVTKKIVAVIKFITVYYTRRLRYIFTKSTLAKL